MKVIIQRVKEASVSVDNKVTGKIGQGYLLYVCFEAGDTMDKVDLAVEKISKFRIFNDDEGKMNLSLSQVQGEVLSISQFTLSWDGKKGHRPSFDKSMQPNEAKIFYRKFNDKLTENGLRVEMGIFGAEMLVESKNDGPVTFILEY
ncbi:MAG: D-tyrosyl-tRNA(Tyr) deacylase [Halobacteriovoraceae bacterium]|nr:D-tyrosyl-tRNA(Tyr) deacylase [Halobacteriovoraceae bacterium]|tara:strand:- start:81 stop:518 length:438 start_codon:yes stop_codon:yes gene_type:complete